MKVGKILLPICMVPLLLASGCTKKIYVPVESVSRDTLIETRLRADTLILRDTLLRIERGDTVYERVIHWRDRFRSKVDTVYQTRIDTVAKTIIPPPATKKGSTTPGISMLIKWAVRVALFLILLVYLVRHRFLGK